MLLQKFDFALSLSMKKKKLCGVKRGRSETFDSNGNVVIQRGLFTCLCWFIQSLVISSVRLFQGLVWGKKLVQTKPFSNMWPHILIQLNKLLQERDKLQEFVVIFVHEPALNGNPIGKLICKGLW